MLTHPKYRPDVDGLRAIAVLSVVAYHAFPLAVRGGFVGVDVFFVISGYLISTIILTSLKSGEFEFGEFYARRVRRIFPALFVVLLACFALGWFALLPGEFQQLGKHMAAGSGFVSNFVLAKESGYFDTAAELKPLLHLWSLGIEEQFYILWPLLLVFFHRRGASLLLTILLSAGLSFAFNVYKVGENAVSAFYLPTGRFWELLVGSLLAYLSVYSGAGLRGAAHDTEAAAGQSLLASLHQRRPGLANVAASLGLALLALAIFTLGREFVFPGWWALLPTVGAFLLIAAGPHTWVGRHILSHRVLVFFGLISFPLYLWHWPALAFARISASETPTLAVRTVAVLLSIVLAWATYAFIERKFRYGEQLRRKAYWLCALVLAVGLLGWATSRLDGFEFRHRSYLDQERTLAAFDDYRKSVAPCKLEAAEARKLSWCVQSRPGAVTAALWGDSHADHLFPGIVGRDPKTNWLFMGQSGCPPLMGVKSFKKGDSELACLKANELALKTLQGNRNIKTVVLASLGPYYISNTSFAAEHIGVLDAGNWKLAAENGGIRSKPDLFYQGLDETIKALKKAGKSVVIVQDIPEMPFMPMACIGRPLALTDRKCRISRAEVIARQAVYVGILHRLLREHPEVRLFQPESYLCDEASCYMGRDGVLYYRDSHHLSLYASDRLGEKLVHWLARP